MLFKEATGAFGTGAVFCATAGFAKASTEADTPRACNSSTGRAAAHPAGAIWVKVKVNTAITATILLNLRVSMLVPSLGYWFFCSAFTAFRATHLKIPALFV